MAAAKRAQSARKVALETGSARTRSPRKKRLSAAEAGAVHLAREERERERATIKVRLEWLQGYVDEANALTQRLKTIGSD